MIPRLILICKEDGTFLKSVPSSEENLQKRSEAKTKNTNSKFVSSNSKFPLGVVNRTADPYIILGIVMLIIVILVVVEAS